MRLYSLIAATHVKHEGKTYTPREDGSFDFPQEVGEAIHRLHVKGQKMWEDDAERAARFAKEELDHQRDPASMFAEVVALRQQLVDLTKPRNRRPAKVD